MRPWELKCLNVRSPVTSMEPDTPPVKGFIHGIWGVLLRQHLIHSSSQKPCWQRKSDWERQRNNFLKIDTGVVNTSVWNLKAKPVTDNICITHLFITFWRDSSTCHLSTAEHSLQIKKRMIVNTAVQMCSKTLKVSNALSFTQGYFIFQTASSKMPLDNYF